MFTRPPPQTLMGAPAAVSGPSALVILALLLLARLPSAESSSLPSPSAVSVTIQASSSSAVSKSAKAPSLPDQLLHIVAYITCFDDKSPSSSANDPTDRSSCCSAMWEATRSICSELSNPDKTMQGGKVAVDLQLSSHTMCRESSRLSWEQSCVERIASVPPFAGVLPVPLDGDDNDDKGNNSSYERSTHMLFLSDHYPPTDIIKTSAVAVEENGSVGYWHYSWYLAERKGLWVPGVSSPFSLQPKTRNDQDEEDEINKGGATQRTSSIPATIISAVSDSGGMHRDHNHRLTLQLSYDEMKSDERETRVMGNVTVLMPLSEDIFVDMDDAIQEDGTCVVNSAELSSKCHVEIVPLPRGVVVDIEQPSFASRQHVLVLQISFETYTNEKTNAVVVDFVSNLHLRYPSPNTGFEVVDLMRGKQRVKSVSIPTTFIGGGRVVETTKDGIRTSILTIEGRNQQGGDFVVLCAAAGHDGDYYIVVLITFVASIVGSLFMIRDISRTSVWV